MIQFIFLYFSHLSNILTHDLRFDEINKIDVRYISILSYSYLVFECFCLIIVLIYEYFTL